MLESYSHKLVLYSRILCPVSKSTQCKCLQSEFVKVYITYITGVSFPTYQSIYCARNYSDNIIEAKQAKLLASDINSRFLVRYELTETSSVFMLFDNFYIFKEFYELLPEGNRAFHEVIFGEYPQRFKVDIDFGDELADCNSPVSHKPFYDKLTVICDTIQNVFNDLYSAQYLLTTTTSNSDKNGNNFNNESNNEDKRVIKHGSRDIDICICETRGIISTTSNKVKIGFHVTIGGLRYARNVEVIREFINVLVSELPPDLVKYIDCATSKSIQNWRILGCNKLGQPRRVKLIYHKPTCSTTPTDSLIGYYDWIAPCDKVYIYDNSTLLSARLITPNRAETHSEIPEKLIDRVVAAADSLLTDAERAAFVYSGVSSNFVNYRRLAPSYCDFCRRTHEKDNTLYFALLGGKSLVKFCRHNSKK